MFSNRLLIKDVDPELQRALDGERQRQEDHIELIASENYTSPRVLEAQGSSLTNKYAEGYPGKRYYGGCEFVDIAEQLAIDRAKKLFGADYANVQPHSGSQANMAVYLALLSPGDVILGMSLDHGGHLTHGAKVNFSGKVFHAFQYGVHPDTGLLDYEQVEALALEHKPKMIVAGFSAYSRVIDWARFRAIADQVGALLFVDMAHVAGLVATGEYPNPLPFSDVVTTTTHKTLRGPRGGMILARANDAITKKLNSMVFPGTQGGPLMHVIAAKAVALLEALQPEFKQYQRQVLANARAMCAALAARGYGIVSGGTDNHLLLLSLVGRDITGTDQHHGQQERGAERSASADDCQRAAAGYPGGHYPRLSRAGNPQHQRLDRGHPRCRWRRQCGRARAAAGDRAVPPIPGVRGLNPDPGSRCIVPSAATSRPR